MHKALVPLKRVIDYNVQVRVKPDKTGVVTDNVKMSMNPFDAIALEEALRLKEQKQVETVTALTIGPKACEDVLRQAYALGADNAIHVLTDTTLEPLAIAKLLAKLANTLQCDLVMMGKQAIDDDNNQTGQMLAGMLNWAQGCFISKIEMEDGTATVIREVDGGLETLQLKLPAVITVDLRLNEPRFPSLPNIMKAKSRPIDTRDLSSFGIEANPQFEVLEVTSPPKREPGVMVENVTELVQKLKDAKVLP